MKIFNMPNRKQSQKKQLPQYLDEDDSTVRFANQGNAKSMFLVGLDYFSGLRVQRNYSEAMMWFKRAASLQYPDAYYYLGLCNENGYGVSRNPTTALLMYKAAKILGDESASKYLQAIEYDKCDNFAMALPVFLELYPRHIDAASFLGFYYLEGLAIQQDYNKAVRYLSFAAESNHEIAINNLGVCYEFGYGVQKNRKHALQLYEKAGTLGNPLGNTNKFRLEDELAFEKKESLRKQAKAYLVEGKYDEALEMYKSVANEGSAEDKFQVGYMYYHGMECSSIGPELGNLFAFDYFRKAAKDGHPLAAQYMGLCCELGRGVTRNRATALKYYAKSIALGNEQARDYYERLKNSLDPKEAYQIAKTYEEEMDYGSALLFYKQSAKHGYIPAHNDVGWFYAQGLGVQVDYSQAAEWYHKGFENKHPSAINNLGNLYEYGNGVQQNRKKALDLYRLAAELGSIKGKENYNRLEKELQGMSPLKRLDELIGLAKVKDEVEGLVRLANYKKRMQEQNLSAPTVSMHMVFEGNPGTGKTTVARLIGEIYHEIGLLPKAECIEVDRSKLVGEYVGHTAVKTQEVIDKAMGGVLFIDEAYTLVKSGDTNDFGQEAIDTLLKSMEDNRDKLVVIVAGYTDEMHRFIDSNPGLQSRFRKYIRFDDYNNIELEQMFYQFSKIYSLTDDAKAEVQRICTEMYRNRSEHFGNGRDVRNFFEAVCERLAYRLGGMEEIPNQSLTLITREDVLAAECIIFKDEEK